jgi:hypothetical protein
MKINIRFITLFLIAFILAFSTTGVKLSPARAAGIIYVDADATGALNGTSWANAYRRLQNALAAATSGDQIWVAGGVYYPDEGTAQVDNDRTSSFILIDGVSIYGGFAGTEALLSDRDINANPTILSGDLDKNDTNTDGNFIAEGTADIVGNNAYHVIDGSSATTTTILDGFTITAGKADGAAFLQDSGGGMVIWSGSGIFNNLIFSGNYAISGGGIFTYNNSTPSLTNVNFNGNQAVSGGGMNNTFSSIPTLENVIFNGNHATSIGGGMFNSSASNSILENVNFTNNTAIDFGAGMYNAASNPIITNTTFENNSAASGGGIFNTQANPILTGVTINNNHANDNGGGMANSQSGPTIKNTTFSDNTATTSAGMYNGSSSNSILANVTFNSNEASSTGGGIYNASSSTAALTNVTFSNNIASIGAGIYILNGTVTLKNTVIANSTGEDCKNNGGTIDPGSSNNLIESTGTSACGLTNGTNGNIIGSDPNLGTLTGSPAYLPLNGGSPAIDAGDDATCAAAPVSNTSQNGVSRPSSTHCDIGSFEKAQVFADVPFDGFAWAQIESIYTAGITGGCSTNPLNYCPNNSVTRAQMAVFLLRGIHGSAYSPPAATGTVFTDVPSDAFAAAWIEQMVAEGITSGCGNGNYCPNSTVTRAQMAVFLLRAKYGSAYSPPVATGTVFTDVPSNGFAAAFIEQLVSEGITSGCGGGNYCPNSSVTRAQMAVFLQRTFNLPLP